MQEMDPIRYADTVRALLAQVLLTIASIIEVYEPESEFVREVQADPLARATKLHEMGRFEIRIISGVILRWEAYQNANGTSVHMRVYLIVKDSEHDEVRTAVREALLKLKGKIPNLYIAK
jgi:hypothetical protein